MSTPTPVFLDCDTGIDDSVALAYLLRSPAIDLVGVGTVSGNTDSAQAARNTLDLLAVADRDDIPVAVGAHDFTSHPYGGGAPHVHGDNGVGDVVLPTSSQPVDERTAVQLLIDLSHTYAGTLHLLTIGPLTNIAAALAADPTLPERIAAVTTMGGTALAAGNISPVAEANIGNDPEAASVVFSADWDVTIVPLDVTMEHTLSDADRHALLESSSPLARAVGEILDHYLDFYLPQYGERLSSLHDPLAAVIAAGAATITRAPLVPVQVDTTDGPGRGQTVVDLRGQRLGDRNHEGVRTRFVRDVESGTAAHLVEIITS
ncbi:purine nucleosidase [Microbacterium halimionae]|uniref:Purine nucleosidase n=1 Tax=Microbacterium halimionae TaxID=1526413 RepID=A0A7W3JQ92_9MICO|nr:nucleoside hydrolase [Microbacterium halimionae]MBA8816976.1 purine nucleosidase [Microbacterium halimionae]NII94485.1 purine nucleosidase [Microbacterium halimionae]